MTLEASQTHVAETVEDASELGPRALRTREAILDAARKLFLDRGYAGTRINNITDEAGVSRAGFYTYFKDKHEVVDILGVEPYKDCMRVVGMWDEMPKRPTVDEIRDWVQAYFDFMDVHGAFIYALAQSGPTDEEFRATARRLQVRAAFLLGVGLRSRQASPTSAPEALGLSILAMLDHSWSQIRVRKLPIDQREVVDAISETILHTLKG